MASTGHSKYYASLTKNKLTLCKSQYLWGKTTGNNYNKVLYYLQNMKWNPDKWHYYLTQHPYNSDGIPTV